MIKVKKLDPKVQLPAYQTKGSACFDLHAHIERPIRIRAKTSVNIPTGLSFEIPEGYVMLVHSRSGHGFKYGLRLVNCTGVIDSDYRGEVRVGIQNDGDIDYIVQVGERVAQAMVIACPQQELVEVQELTDTDRGINGFGSTGS